jgi:hypothetical protein
VKKIPLTQPLPLMLGKASFLRKSLYRHFLNDPNFNRWFRNLMRGNTVTAAEHEEILVASASPSTYLGDGRRFVGTVQNRRAG